MRELIGMATSAKLGEAITADTIPEAKSPGESDGQMGIGSGKGKQKNPASPHKPCWQEDGPAGRVLALRLERTGRRLSRWPDWHPASPEINPVSSRLDDWA